MIRPTLCANRNNRLVLERLVALRHKAGLTQRELAQRLGREHSFIWRIETGERRLDVLEFHWVCEALGQNAIHVYRELVTAFKVRGAR